MNAECLRFEAMFRQHYAAVLRYATRRVGTDGANEIVGETFLTAWRRLDQVPDQSLPWLYGTARRVVANELRRRARAARLDQRIDSQPRSETADPGELVPQRLVIAAALESLSERDREVLRLTEWEQLGPTEVAVVLSCSTAAAKVRVHRARRRFGAALGASGTDAAHPTSLLPSGESA